MKAGLPSAALGNEPQKGLGSERGVFARAPGCEGVLIPGVAGRATGPSEGATAEDIDGSFDSSRPSFVSRLHPLSTGQLRGAARVCRLGGGEVFRRVAWSWATTACRSFKHVA